MTKQNSNLDLQSGNRVINALDPANPQDGATKHYVDLGGYLQAAIRHIVAFGHSGMAGGGSDDVSTRGWGHMLASMLGASFENFARGGADAVSSEQVGANRPGGPTAGGSGGWAQLLALLSPPIQTVNSIAAGGITTVYPLKHTLGEPYIPPAWMPLIFFGNNDLGQWGNTSRPMNAWLDAMRTILSRTTASAVYEENDATVGFNNVFGTTAAQGTWTASLGGSFGLGSGNDLRQIPSAVTTGTAGITINVPADFQAGDIVALGFSLQTSVTAGQLTVAVDGSSAGLPNGGVIPLANRTPGNGKTLIDQALGIVYRLGGSLGGLTTSGAHTITINVSSAITGAAYFDYWQVEAGADKAPISAIVPSLFKPYTYTIWPTPLPTDADVDAWNAALSSMLTNEFPNALYVDLSALLPRTSVTPWWYSDQTHPSNLGHAMIAGAVFDSLKSAEQSMTSTNIAYQQREPARERLAVWTAGSGATWPTVNWTTFGGSLSPVIIGSPAMPPEVVLPASPGDLIECGVLGIWDNTGTGSGYADVAIMSPYAQGTNPQLSLVAGGTLTVGTALYYWISCYNANGETVAGGPATITPTTGNQSVRLSFWVPSGTTGVRIYRTTSTSYPTSGVNMVAQITALTQGATNTYTDTGIALTGTFPPQVNLAWNGPIRYASGVANGFWLAGPTTWSAIQNGGGGFFQVMPADAPGGSIILRLAVRVSASTRGISGGAANTVQFIARNHGRQVGRVDLAA